LHERLRPQFFGSRKRMKLRGVLRRLYFMASTSAQDLTNVNELTYALLLARPLVVHQR
jgi:hypothetical protein